MDLAPDAGFPVSPSPAPCDSPDPLRLDDSVPETEPDEDFNSPGSPLSVTSSIDPPAIVASTSAGYVYTLAADIYNLSSYQQARQSGEWSEWRAAMDKELQKMERYEVFGLVPHKGQRVLKTHWVYTRKINGETGKVAAYKAWWVAKGYSQIQGITYNDIHALVVHQDMIRVLLALINHLNLKCDLVDIVAAFLNGDTRVEIFPKPPGGSDAPHGQIIRLQKSLYGLKQSPRCFDKAFDAYMKEEGYRPSTADPCLQIFNNDGILIYASTSRYMWTIN